MYMVRGTITIAMGHCILGKLTQITNKGWSGMSVPSSEAEEYPVPRICPTESGRWARDEKSELFAPGRVLLMPTSFCFQGWGRGRRIPTSVIHGVPDS